MAASSMRVLAHRVFDDLQSINDSNDPKNNKLTTTNHDAKLNENKSKKDI